MPAWLRPSRDPGCPWTNARRIEHCCLRTIPAVPIPAGKPERGFEIPRHFSGRASGCRSASRARSAAPALPPAVAKPLTPRMNSRRLTRPCPARSAEAIAALQRADIAQFSSGSRSGRHVPRRAAACACCLRLEPYLGFNALGRVIWRCSIWQSTARCAVGI